MSGCSRLIDLNRCSAGIAEALFLGDGRPGRGLALRPGLVLALEPMLTTGGTDAYDNDPDGWALRTADGTRAAHIEHTVAITENGAEVLTQLAMTQATD